ncbi:hypothetical protein GCM10027445_06940 [Amycolatopsis endophytica]|uniref:DUF4333 domain-containing protein n=1 Tax=Amycolatopsis endophytica TaxID=860233 RepID=A0A853AW78_9PSEU|nr:DUF4333 domain-containing protein [Amycolatopsis endophytica]NYI86932.1 hypothetical protein [Amycolatopsis endophytica]
MIRTALVACVATFLLTGCSVQVGTVGSLSQETVEQGISDALLTEIGHRPDGVDCPDPLDAKAGKSTRCVLTDQGMRVGVTATVTDVQGGTANYHVQVDNEPLPSSGWFG